MDEVTLLKALVHIIGLILSITIIVTSRSFRDEKREAFLVLGAVALLVYFLVVPEYLNMVVFGGNNGRN